LRLATRLLRRVAWVKQLHQFSPNKKPEAAYFLAVNGQRTGLIFLDMQDVSQIPSLAEPWFLSFNASVEISPVMTPDDLKKATKDIEKAVKKYG